MDLTDLELVVAVADAGSITHGAARSHLSLPSASARIRALENAVGATLFERDRRGVTPTPAGHLLLRHARTVCQAVGQLHTELAEHADGRGTTVRVLANAAAASLSPVVVDFLVRRKDIHVDLDERPGPQIVTAVAERRAELGIVSDSVDLGGLATTVLRPDPLVVVTPPADSLIAAAPVGYPDLVDRPFVGLNGPMAFPVSARPVFRLRLPSIDAVCHAVAAGLGIAVLPRRGIEEWVSSGAVAAVEVHERWARRDLVACFTAEAELSEPTRALRDYLVG